jgi:mannitol-1-phosphate/altronate dehydrogenase
MYEGLRTASRLGKHFANLESYKNGFGSLLKDKGIKKFNQTVLKRMRNKFVFHFDQDVMAESFQEFELSEYVFALGKGKATGELYFGLADEAVFNYLLQPEQNESNDSLMERYKEILQTTTELMKRFTDSAEHLMADVLSDMGFTIETN